MATIIVIDPVLEAGASNRLDALRRLISACRKGGTPIRILCQQECDVESVDAVVVEKLLTATNSAASLMEALEAQRLLRKLAIDFRNGLRKVLMDCDSEDTIHLLHANLPMLRGVAAWAASVPEASLPSLALASIEPPDNDVFAASLQTTHAVAATVDHLRSVFAGRFSCPGSGQPGPLGATGTNQSEIAVRSRQNAPTDDRLPTIDIIVTLHNYRRFIERCLHSVASQTYPAWRCVVVDDGSNDVTFDELRGLVGSFGERFAVVRHEPAAGQIEATATGLSLSSNPFVVLLDADDELTEHALDHHISWHLNSAVPVALTSGHMYVIDTNGRMLAGSCDHVPWLEEHAWLYRLAPEAAWRRPQSETNPAAAVFVNQRQAPLGIWHWSPTSGLMFRRSIMELFLPERFAPTRLAPDTYFALTAEIFGGALLIDAHVARYRRHGGNNIGAPAVYGSGTLAIPPSDPGWPEVARLLRTQIEGTPGHFFKQISHDLIDRFLSEAPLGPEALDTAAVPLGASVKVIERLGDIQQSDLAEIRAGPTAAIIESASFETGGRGCRLLHIGWSRPESWGCWSMGPRAILKWPLHAPPITKLLVHMDANLFTNKEQSVAVTVNGTKVATIIGRSGEHTCTFELSADLALARSPMQIEFEIAHPISPKDIDFNHDTRKIGIGLQRIRLEYGSDGCESNKSRR